MVEPRYKTAFTLYPYARVPAQDKIERPPVVIVGGGPVGMALALDLGQKGIRTVVLDDHDGVGDGSRAICFAKRTLEIADRLGCGDPLVDKGVVWSVGRVYRGTQAVYDFNLLPEDGHKRPAFINLQQPYFEKVLVEAIRREQARGAPVEIRGRNRVVAIEPADTHVNLTIDTPDGPYRAEADYLIACDGANSAIRGMMNLGFEGRVFEDNFLIADIRMQAAFPTERRFWFDPPFNPGQTALLHKQPDNIWRLDFQLGWDIDREKELQEDAIRARVRGMIGDDIPFELDWTSIYTFRCCTMERYVHDRVIFAGDSAHQVSPFGARGANGGMQDVDNLAWKLAAVIKGEAPAHLLETYHAERKQAAEENIMNSSRTADFLTPRTPVHTLFRDAVLDLVKDHPFARPFLNSGRLSTPCTYEGSALSSADTAELPARTRPGAAASDAPTKDGWLLDHLGGDFCVLAIGDAPPETPLRCHHVEATPEIADRYLGSAPSALYLIRPDQHIAARWCNADAAMIAAAHRKALGT